MEHVHRGSSYRQAGPWILGCLVLSLLCSACSVTQLLPEGEQLYTGASLRLERPDTTVAPNLANNLQNVIAPNPNTRLFGFPWKAWFYLKFKTDKQKGLKHWLSTTIGEPPVLYDPLQTEQVVRLLENRAQNMGHFRAEAEADTQSTSKKVHVDYRVRVEAPYRIDSLHYYINDTSLATRLTKLRPASFIRSGQIYSLETLKRERQRIEDALRSQGYFYFNAGDLEYFADTSGFSTRRKVDLLLKLKNDLPPQNLEPQLIKRVNIYSNYRLDGVGNRPLDSILVEGLYLYCDRCPLKANVLAESFLIKPGLFYSPTNHRKTLERLSNLNTFKYINLDYDPVDGSDSLMIVNAYLSPRARRTIEGEIGAAYNTGKYFGPEIAVKYINRNLFRGAEFFTIDSRYSYNTFLGAAEEAIIPRWTRLSLAGTLSIPRFWLPRREALSKNLQYANTRIRLSLDNENLGFRLSNLAKEIEDLGLNELLEALEADSTYTPSVKLSNWQFKYGYNWQRIPSLRHETNPLTIRLQTVGVDNSELLDLFRSFSVGDRSSLVRLERMLLFSPDYSLLYDSRLARLQRHNFLYRQRLAFNINEVTPLSDDANLQPETSLFLQWETDFHYYLTLGPGRQLASKLRVYAGYPISERAIIPYFDLYTVGGANSLRAFPPRGVGPGTIAPQRREEFTIFTGYGNILLETSVEYRQRLGPYLEIAPFFDAGNIWQYRTQSEVPAAEFSFKNFLGELAADTGVGFRYDLEFLLIRLDFAWPITQPWQPKGERVVIDQFFNNGWWWENLNFVLAFGYPF